MTAPTGTDERAPCPFCGSLKLHFTSNGAETNFVECVMCGASGPAENHERKAVIAWNRRASLGAAQVPAGFALVPMGFVQGFNTLAHNYSLNAVPPDYYRGTEGDAFSNAYRRCGQDLAKLRAMLAAAPEAWAGAAQVPSLSDVRDAARYRWLRDDATQAQQDGWLMRLPEQADAYADAALQPSQQGAK